MKYHSMKSFLISKTITKSRLYWIKRTLRKTAY